MGGEYLNAKIGGVPNTKIHIRNIPPHVTENHLRSILGNIGYIKDLCYFNKNKRQMNNFSNVKVYNTALITFNTHEEALNILQNIHNLIDTSGEEKTIEAKFAVPNNAINTNNSNNATTGNMFNRSNYVLPYPNNQNSFNDSYNDNMNNTNGGSYLNNKESTLFNENNVTGGTANCNFLNRSVKSRNNNSNNNNNTNNANNNNNKVAVIKNKPLNALGNSGINSNNYMFAKYPNAGKNDSAQMVGRENESSINLNMRQHNYQLNNFQVPSSSNNNHMNGLAGVPSMANITNMTNVNTNNAVNNHSNLYSSGDNFLWENENEKNMDGLSLWESYKDSNNNVYYYNNLTKHSQWKKPIHPSKLFQHNNAEKVKQSGPQGSNLFIFHIPSEWSDVDLFEHFCCFGNIISSKIQRDSTGRNSGFGFVSYDNTISAQKAIHHMNGYFVNNKYLKVQLKKGEVVNEAQA